MVYSFENDHNIKFAIIMKGTNIQLRKVAVMIIG